MAEARTFSLNGKQYTVRELAQIAGIDRSTMNTRLQYMTPEDAVSKPIQEKPRYFLGFREMSLEEIAHELSIDIKSIRERAHNGHMSVQAAVNEAYEYKMNLDASFERMQKLDGDKPLSERWCFGCEWAKWHGVQVSCPFVAGSCIKLPETMRSPDHKLVTGGDFQKAKTEAEIRAKIYAVKLLQQRMEEVRNGQSTAQKS